MAEPVLTDQITALRSQLTAIDAQLARSASAPEGLEDLKAVVDNLRTSVWAILSASRASNYHVFIERFRLRRAIDILRTLVNEIEPGEGRMLHAEHSELQIIAQQLMERIGRLRQQGS
jgi:hypothetical protein